MTTEDSKGPLKNNVYALVTKLRRFWAQSLTRLFEAELRYAPAVRPRRRLLLLPGCPPARHDPNVLNMTDAALPAVLYGAGRAFHRSRS